MVEVDPALATAGMPAAGPRTPRRAAASRDPLVAAVHELVRSPTGRVAWDEMFESPGVPRRAWKQVHAALSGMSGDELRSRVDTLARTYLDQGVTFDLGGEERPFPLDLVPRVIAAAEWDVIERGVTQRVRALEAFLADVYGRRDAVRDGVIPLKVLVSASNFHREAAGMNPANGVRVHVAGIDLVRDEDGDFRVLEDNVRVPSGVSYVLANRQAVSQVFSEAFANQRIRPVSDYPRRLLAALRAAAPDGTVEPTVVVLTPGIYNSAYFEHALLARSMGIELVEGRDLACHHGQVWMRTTSGERRVDVIYRRIDDEYMDPIHFRSDSLLGCPGLLTAARAGNVAIANGIGNGVADDKLVYTYLPDLLRYYLGEEPILANVQTWRLEEADARAEVLDQLADVVVKPVDGSGGKGLVIGPAASVAELDELRSKIIEDPRGWIAQPVVQLSTVPTLCGLELQPRHVDLRPFAVNDGEKVWVLPGGLTRVALDEGQLVVNSSQGGGSKDTWVLRSAGRNDLEHRAASRRKTVAVLPEMAVPDPGPDDNAISDQQQQQQQQTGGASQPHGGGVAGRPHLQRAAGEQQHQPQRFLDGRCIPAETAPC